MKHKQTFLLAALAVLLAAGRGAAEPEPAETVVRVRPTPAGPQIHVNGKPMPGRMFWGQALTRKLPVGPEWNRFEYTVTPRADVPRAGFRIRFEATNNVPEIRNFRFERTDGATLITNHTLRADLTTLQFTRGVDALAKDVPCRFSFEARAVTPTWIRPALHQYGPGVYNYWLMEIPLDDGNGLTLVEQAKLARKHGVRLISCMTPNSWMPDGDDNFGPIDHLFRQIIEAVPDALIIPRVTVNAPAWWLKKYPGARVVMQDGETVELSSVSSRLYRKEAAAFLERIVKHLCVAFPKHFAGVHFSGQACGEWCYWDCWRRGSGYDPAAKAAFRAWLAVRGAPDAAMAEPPTMAERRLLTDDMRLLDPATRKRLIEFNYFLQEEMSDIVGELATVARRASGGKKIVGAFYGYDWEHAKIWQGASITGSGGLWRLIEKSAADFDMLAAPITYSDRGWLGTTPVIGVVETLARKGILWMNEDDFRTPLADEARPLGEYCFITNRSECCETLLRTTAQEAIRGISAWWMDLPGSGWFNDPAYWKVLSDFDETDRMLLARKRPYKPDVAVTIDEDSIQHIACAGNHVTSPLICKSRKSFPRAGVTFGQYLLNDLVRDPVDMKLQIHLAAWHLSPETERALVRQIAATPDITRVWCWAPGYIGEDKFDPAGTERLTGFKVSPSKLANALCHVTPLGRKLGLPETWGVDTRENPMLGVETQPGDEVWATWGDGAPAVVVRPNKGGVGFTIFEGACELPPALVWAFANKAGVRRYFSCADVGKAVVFATDGFAVVQALEDGARILDFGNGPVETAFRKGEIRCFTWK